MITVDYKDQSRIQLKKTITGQFNHSVTDPRNRPEKPCQRLKTLDKIYEFYNKHGSF